MPEPTVPNWIAKAVILYSDAAVPICEWRCTRTQVVVRTTPTGPERRFRLDDLREVGNGWTAPRLAAPDDPRVLGVQKAAIIRKASSHVWGVIVQQRMQDSTNDAAAAAAKLLALRSAVDQALASLSEVL